ncbi:ABC transporter permease [Kineococcus sp. SYSU DK003]|uniref:ABC transporter permease n=1 Tax=Kineococcus sp. SYSU DK003 TaxID=3383124 RepID=UPI003D7DA771
MRVARTGASFLVLAVLWELLGRSGLVSAFPPLTAIAGSWWEHRADYPDHVLATTTSAAAGFALGNLVAVFVAVLFALSPVAERLGRALTVVLFCLPVVVVAPILGIAFEAPWPRVLLAALCVFFPTLVATGLGLSQAPGDALAVVRSAGGGAFRAAALVRARAALPDLLGGLQVAAPAAVLGAMLGEFLGGGDGLGVYLLGSMGRADPAALWAVGLTATVLSVVVYGVFGVLRAAAGADTARLAAEVPAQGRTTRNPVRFLWPLGGLAVVVVAWYAFLAATGLPRTLMNSPLDVVEALTTAPIAAERRAELLDALSVSLPPAVLGAGAGLLLALVLAVALSVFPAAARTVLPFAFLSQTMPLVALTPLIALLFGRGTLTIVLVTVSVTFFPALVAISQGIAAAPTGPLQVLRSVNASRTTVLSRYVLPQALPHVLSAVRLAVPRALTGVVLAEQFVTGTGLGNLLGASRGTLDYRMMWIVAAVVAALSVAGYALARGLEHAVLRRR